MRGFPCGIHSRICGNGCAYREWWDTEAFNKKAKVLQEICPSKRVRKKFVPNRFYKKIGMKKVGYINWSKGTMKGNVWKWEK